MYLLLVAVDRWILFLTSSEAHKPFYLSRDKDFDNEPCIQANVLPVLSNIYQADKQLQPHQNRSLSSKALQTSLHCLSCVV
uniref:Secreted protein n=1 Tax=Tetranychus urticae TaxID=32264 RepID=T1JQJ6_TETUR